MENFETGDLLVVSQKHSSFHLAISNSSKRLLKVLPVVELLQERFKPKYVDIGMIINCEHGISMGTKVLTIHPITYRITFLDYTTFLELHKERSIYVKQLAYDIKGSSHHAKLVEEIHCLDRSVDTLEYFQNFIKQHDEEIYFRDYIIKELLSIGLIIHLLISSRMLSRRYYYRIITVSQFLSDNLSEYYSNELFSLA